VYADLFFPCQYRLWVVKIDDFVVQFQQQSDKFKQTLRVFAGEAA